MGTVDVDEVTELAALLHELVVHGLVFTVRRHPSGGWRVTLTGGH